MKPIFFIAILSLLITACNSHELKDGEETKQDSENRVALTEAQVKNADIQIGKMEQKLMSSILKVNGKIEVPPQNMVSISVPLGGYLKTTHLLQGMHVNKGEVIAVMEDQQYIQLQQEYLTAKSKVKYAEIEFKRQKELIQTQSTSDKTFQQSESEFKNLQIELNALVQKLQLVGIKIQTITEASISRSINIYSPIDGFVTKVNVNIGKYVSPTDVLFELVNPSDIHLALNVFEKDLSKIFIGQKLTAYTNNLPNKKHACEILLIGKDISAERNTEVHCHFDAYDKTLIPGTYMNAEIEVKSNNSMVLPEDAVVFFKSKYYVFRVISALQFDMEEVNIGVTENGFTEILIDNSSTFTKDSFVTKGAYSLLMSLKNKEE